MIRLSDTNFADLTPAYQRRILGLRRPLAPWERWPLVHAEDRRGEEDGALAAALTSAQEAA